MKPERFRILMPNGTAYEFEAYVRGETLTIAGEVRMIPKISKRARAARMRRWETGRPKPRRAK